MAKSSTPAQCLEHLVEIFVPTICRCREPLPDALITQMLEETKAKMSGWFGGGTVRHDRIVGFWGGEDGTTVEEPVYLVFSNATADKLEDHREDVMEHTAAIANRLTQEATALRIDAKMYLFPSTGEPRPHRCGGGLPTAGFPSPHPADKLTKKRFLQATLQRIGSLTSVRDVFCNHLHYEFADEILATPEWPEVLKRYLAPGAPPQLLAQQNGFRIIYLQLANNDLRKGHERQLIQRLIKDDPALRGLVVVSDVDQTQWNLINVKFTRQQEADKKSDRLLLRRMRVGRDQAVRTAVERLIEVDIEVIGEDKDAAAIQDAHDKAFDVDAVTKQFFTEIAGWYFWALPRVTFPNDTGEPDEKVRATSLIRLLTRLIFCWFLREKKLVPANLFEQRELVQILKDLTPDSSSYYQGILQNLFFATLNQRMGKDTHLRPYRAFASDEGFAKNRSTYGIDTLYRYEEHFREPGNVIELFADIPFLNGGLFECLDRVDEKSGAKIYIEGFSRNPRKRAKVPNDLFFAEERTVDLSSDFGDPRRRGEKVRGLLRILHSYNFTIEENTPVDEEVALDPELLGKVFENLLASYNEETKTTARKQTGSFYTPRPIVNYMVDESLNAYLSRVLLEKAGMQEADAKAGLDQLFSYNAEPHQFSEAQVDTLIAAIDQVKILDPACGSGAFPMGVLHKLVHLLGKLDPDNGRWRQTQLAKLDSPAMREVLEASFTENNDDYGRKLSLIQNCLYGVDIQPIAIQITKLRFFISLVCEQKTNRSKKDNHGIRPLPNLETRFVAANTLIGLPIPEPDLFLRGLIEPIEKKIETAYHSHFAIQRRDQKLALQSSIKALRRELTDTLLHGLGADKDSEVSKKAQHLALWDPFDPQISADFFDPQWMFGKSLSMGFDIVIGNPPYGANIDSMATLFERLYPNTTKSFKDIYKLFIEAGLARLLKPNGVICYITPNTLLRQPRYKDARAFLDRYRILHVIDFGFGIFEQVVPTCVFLATKSKSTDKLVRYLDLTDKAQFTKDLNSEIPIQIPQSKLLDLSHSEMSLNAVQGVELIRIDDVLDLKDAGINYQRVNVGLHDKGNSNLSKRLLYDGQRESADDVEYWKGIDIGKYQIANSTGRFVRVATVHSLKPNERVVLNREYFAKKPKLIWRQTAAHLMVAVDDVGRWFGRSIQAAIIKPKFRSLDYFFVLGLLNSSYLRHSYNRRVQEAGRVFPQVKFENLKSLLLAIPNTHTQQTIASQARAITDAKQANPAADTSALEREIDQQVYVLYGLTSEEIAIVEGSAT